MKCEQVAVEEFTLPLKLPLTVKGHLLKERKGLRLTLTDDEGQSSVGDIMPLPYLHLEDVEDAKRQLEALPLSGRELPNSIVGFDLFFSSLSQDRLLPSVRMGLEMAVAGLLWGQNKYKGQPVRLNGLLPDEEYSFMETAAELLKQGYKSIKLKVGREPLDQEFAAINKLRELIGDKATLRLDANRAWTFDQAIIFARAIGTAGIEYIEEPILGGADLEYFYQQTKMPVALDESLLEKDPEILLNQEGVAAIILKPAVFGSLQRVLDYIGFAKKKGITPVLSSVFESTAALEFYSRLAVFCEIEEIAHGLDTWRWLKGASLNIRSGCLVL